MSQTIPRTAKDIADEAIEAVGYGHEQSKWLSVLFDAVQLDARHNNGRNAAALASLGQYLAYDCANYLETQSGTLRRQLKAVGGAQ